MSDEAQEVIPPARSFADLLRQIEAGRFLTEISDAMRDLSLDHAVREDGGAAVGHVWYPYPIVPGKPG